MYHNIELHQPPRECNEDVEDVWTIGYNKCTHQVITGEMPCNIKGGIWWVIRMGQEGMMDRWTR